LGIILEGLNPGRQTPGGQRVFRDTPPFWLSRTSGKSTFWPPTGDALIDLAHAHGRLNCTSAAINPHLPASSAGTSDIRLEKLGKKGAFIEY
jgi:hypothetical protein